MNIDLVAFSLNSKLKILESKYRSFIKDSIEIFQQHREAVQALPESERIVIRMDKDLKFLQKVESSTLDFSSRNSELASLIKNQIQQAQLCIQDILKPSKSIKLMSKVQEVFETIENFISKLLVNPHTYREANVKAWEKLLAAESRIESLQSAVLKLKENKKKLKEKIESLNLPPPIHSCSESPLLSKVKNDYNKSNKKLKAYKSRSKSIIEWTPIRLQSKQNTPLNIQHLNQEVEDLKNKLYKTQNERDKLRLKVLGNENPSKLVNILKKLKAHLNQQDLDYVNQAVKQKSKGKLRTIYKNKNKENAVEVLKKQNMDVCIENDKLKTEYSKLNHEFERVSEKLKRKIGRLAVLEQSKEGNSIKLFEKTLKQDMIKAIKAVESTLMEQMGEIHSKVLSNLDRLDKIAVNSPDSLEDSLNFIEPVEDINYLKDEIDKLKQQLRTLEVLSDTKDREIVSLNELLKKRESMLDKIRYTIAPDFRGDPISYIEEILSKL